MQETHTLEKKDWAAKLLAIAVVVFMVSSTVVLFAPEASARTGTGSYGYTFKDNLESGGPDYSTDWIDTVVTEGTNILSYSSDAAQGTFNLPFDFEYYENTYSTWGNGGDNGYITFGGVISNAWTPYNIPATQIGSAAVAGGWFDGGFCRASNPDAGVYHQTIGTSPNQIFVVHYEDQGAWYPSVYTCPGVQAADALTWQIQIHESTMEVKTLYKDVQGGYSSDNEWMTVGIQGSPGGSLMGLEYSYRQSPDVPQYTAVTFSGPAPPVNDLRLTQSTIPDPVSLADQNLFGAEVTNKGVNCDRSVDSECMTPETNIDVTASVFSIEETETLYTFDDGDEGFTSGSYQGMNKWTRNLNDGAGNYNYGDDGTTDGSDGAWSSGRKSSAAGGMFSDSEKIHYDGTNILIANKFKSEVLELDLSVTPETVSTIIGPDATNLMNVLDVTSDADYYYTLSRTSNLASYATRVCKWDKSDTATPEACNTSSVQYGIALTIFGDDLVALQGGWTTSASRKAVILDATSSSLAATGRTIPYYAGISAYSYASNIDVDESNGDMYIVYRDFQGIVRNYERQGDGTYCASSACYTQAITLARYSSSVDIQDGYMYTNGYYYSSYYGGLRKCTTGTSITCSALWTWFGDTGYHGSGAMTSDGDFYVNSNYAFRYNTFNNYDDKLWVHEACSPCADPHYADRTLGPSPAMLSHLTTPTYDTSAAVGMTMDFMISYQFYYLYEGAYLESTVDGGSTWNYVDGSEFTSGGYNNYVYANYNNPLEVGPDYWTQYNTVMQYTYMTHTAPWKKASLNLDPYTGYTEVAFRWVVGYNQFLQAYYDSFFRLDDVTVTIKEAGQTFVEETQTIASLDYKTSESVDFFTGCSDSGYSTEETCEAAGKAWGFRPADTIHGLSVGDKVGVLISVPNNGGDEDMSNNRAVAFREVKFVVFADNFEDGDMTTSEGDWVTDKVKFGRGDWDVRNRDSFGGSYSMDSGLRSQGAVPGDGYVSSPALDLSLPVEAEIQMMMSYYCYYTYDGYQMQISDDDGATWGLLTPSSTAGDGGGYPQIIYNYAYYGNPLRGQRGYTFYGTTTTTYSYSPDPQAWVKVTFDLTPYVGQDDIKFRVVAGWTNAPNYAYWESFLRFDDFAVTGLVYNDNVGLSALELPDPLGIDETVEVGTTVVNAGINDQANGAVKLQLSVGPLGIETLPTSDDLESYADQAQATSSGVGGGNWSASSDCSDAVGNSCLQWGTYGGEAGFVFNTDEGDAPETNSWGSDGTEFQMFYGGGSTDVTTEDIDFTGAPADMIMSLKHRYNYDIYAGYPSYNGGNVKINVDGESDEDGNLIWNILTPNGGYPGVVYNAPSWGQPLSNEPAFVHCGSCPGSGAAMDDEDEYITSEFDMSGYIGQKVQLKFMVGMYKWKWPDEGEHWHIDSMLFTGTGMESVSFSDMVTVSGTGANFGQGESVYKKWDYHFQVPGEYRIQLDTWIGACNPSSFGYACDVPFGAGDDFSGDNQVALARETMFMVAGTTADETALGTGNDEFGQRFYDNDWMSLKNDQVKNGFQWRPSAGGTPHDPVWWSGPSTGIGTPNNGDDVSLTSPVFDLSKASSAKLVFQHRFMFYGSESAFSSYYYEGGRVEISKDGGTKWEVLNPSSGEAYGGTIYNYLYYGNPLDNQPAFVMSSSGGSAFVETQCRLDAYTGAGFDNMRIRFHFGGSYPAWDSNWEIDDVGIYALGFDLKQTSASTPYTLEVGETATISTSFSNPGLGNLGPGGAVESAYAYAYVNDISGNEVWSDSKDIGDLDMAYYDSTGATYPGEVTDTISFTYPGMDAAGMYTVGVKVADSTGATLSDLFAGNNDASHMMAVGLHADMGDPVLTGLNWAEVDSEPTDADGAMGIAWDETGVASGTLSVSIVGMAGYDPASPSVQIGTTVTWTNNDVIAHTVTDKDGTFDSFQIAAGAGWQQTFNTVGVYNYYCKNHIGMEGSITVLSDSSADEKIRTNNIEVWSADSYLVFWANFDMSEDSSISVYAQPNGVAFDHEDTKGLWKENGFQVMDGSDHSESSLSDLTSSGWNPYYVHLDSNKMGYKSLEYDPSKDNSYSFVFRARGTSGTAEIGGVQVIRTLDTGFFMTKDDHSELEYEIFPSLAVEIDYFAKNIGTVDNTLRLNPGLIALGNAYEGEAFEITIQVTMNGASFDSVDTSQKTDGTWSHEIDMEPDDEAMITIRFAAPDFNAETGEPAGSRKFDVALNAYDTGSGESLREPIAATLYIPPSQFVLGEISFNREAVLEGDSLDITVRASNEGNYASDVLVVFYVMDSSGDAYETLGGQGPVQRMTRVASTTVDLMAPVPVLESDGVYKTWYEATATWDVTSIPGETVQDYETVNIYAEINPLPDDDDLAAGYKVQNEYDDEKDDNDATGQIHVVKGKSSTPSFAVGIIGMSMAALVAAIGASLRREEE